MTGKRSPDPTRRLIITPRREVDTLCRLSLHRYLLEAAGEAAAVAVGAAVQEIESLQNPDRVAGEAQRSVWPPAPRGTHSGCASPPQTSSSDHGSDGPLASIGAACTTDEGGPAGKRGFHDETAQVGAHRRAADSAAETRATWAAVRSALDVLTIVDPACGEGHMLLGMLDLLDAVGSYAAQSLGLDESRLERRQRIVERTLHGVEAQPATLERAAERLMAAACRDAAPRPPSSERQAPRHNLLCADSLVERGGFRWAASFPAVHNAGGFGLVIGNPPYVRHELIADPLGRLPAGEYKDRALAALRERLPEFFESGAVWDGRADLSLLFTLLGCSLLRDTGLLAFVLPTGLFAARYGDCLWRFLRAAGRTGTVVENVERRPFGDASVNTAFFLAWRVGETVASPIRSHGEAGATRSAFQNLPGAASSRPRRAELHRFERRSNARVRMGAGEGALDALLRRLEARTVRLGSLGRVRYPVKTGINRFFYPDGGTCARFGIEPQFLRPLVKSPREVRTIALTADDLSAVLFHCPLTPPALAESGARGALAYIAWGEAQSTPPRGGTGTRTPWPSVPSVRGRRPWYAVSLPDGAHILCPRFFDRRFFFPMLGAGMVEDQTFYGLVLPSENAERRDLIAALLNCSFSYLLLETHGRTGLGDGVRQYALCDMAALPVLDPTEISPPFAHEIAEAFRPLARRPILPVEREVEQGDRKELDALVCGALGMAHSDAAAARAALPLLVGARLERARR